MILMFFFFGCYFYLSHLFDCLQKKECIDLDPSVIPKALQTVALRKIASPLEVANAIGFLASSAASHISGCVLEVHGGMEGRCLNPL